eukprot:TRINITY_DN4885_c0_g1_i1.p1 TRINITY_DN4885_c0_g1~~TRINITY_DN4885_c0_g1_i1.p1  ORF type:complete len:602 (-),score=69.76 TRINITY_DN4885_c0_g1_i1:90-1895(-)
MASPVHTYNISGFGTPEAQCFQAVFYVVGTNMHYPLLMLISQVIGMICFAYQVLKTLKDIVEAIRGERRMDDVLLPQYLIWLFVLMLVYFFTMVGIILASISDKGQVIVGAIATLSWMCSFVMPAIWVHQPDISSSSRRRTFLVTGVIGILYLPIVLESYIFTFEGSVPIQLTVDERYTWPVRIYSWSYNTFLFFVILLFIFLQKSLRFRDFAESKVRALKKYRSRIRSIDYLIYCEAALGFNIINLVPLNGLACTTFFEFLFPAFWPIIFFFVLRRDSRFWRKAGSEEYDAIIKSFLKDLTAEHWAISYAELIIDRVVGKGASGTVHLGNWRGIKVAIKIFNTTSLEASELDEFIGEVAILRRLHHPHVVQLIGAVVEAPNFALVTEFLDKGSLSDVLEDQTLDIDWPLKLKFAKEAALGLYYLHTFDPQIVHRDIKSSNFLVDHHFTVKVGDLGAAQLQDNNSTLTFQGTPRWTAPEAMEKSGFTEKSDVYSFGIVLWEIYTREIPYPEYKFTAELVLKVINEDLRPKIPEDCPQDYVYIMESCWARLPENRPTMSLVMKQLLMFEESLLGPSDHDNSRESMELLDRISSRSDYEMLTK